MAQRDTALYGKLRDARREQTVTQSQLAREIGCRQSAISMMERGNPTALAWETVERIADFLHVDLSGHVSPAKRSADADHAPWRFCPVFDCPSNLPYVVQGELHFLPAGGSQVPASGHYCRYCGEVLESTCPNTDCSASVVPTAACCPDCGTPYVAAVPDELPLPPAMWAEAQLARMQMMGLVGPTIRSLVETQN